MMKEKTAEQVWNGCLEIIKDNVSPQNFKTWFDPIKPIKLNNSVLTIQVPSQFFYEWIEEHYITLIKKVIKNRGRTKELFTRLLHPSRLNKNPNNKRRNKSIQL